MRFGPEDRLILRLCRNIPDSDSLLREIRWESVRWRKLVGTARVHLVAPLVLDRLLRLPLPAGARAALQDAARREIVAAVHDNVVFRNELARLLPKLRSKGIEVILLKGLSLNFSGLRFAGDIDLLVPETRLADAIDSLLELDGFSYRRMRLDGPEDAVSFSRRLPESERRRVQRQLAWNNEFHLGNSKNGVLVELHHKPFMIRNSDGRFMESTEGVLRATPLFWRERRFDLFLGCHVLSAGHSLLLACLRNSIKQQPANNSFRLSNLVDIENLVAAGVPWKPFVRDCFETRAAPHVLFSLRLARSLLGTPVPPSVLDELGAACTPSQRYALSLHWRCVASLGPSSIVPSNLYKAVSPIAFGGTPWDKLKGLLFLSVWLPSRWRMAMFYGLKKESPLIALAYLVNPLRWVRKILRAVLASR